MKTWLGLFVLGVLLTVCAETAEAQVVTSRPLNPQAVRSRDPLLRLRGTTFIRQFDIGGAFITLPNGILIEVPDNIVSFGEFWGRLQRLNPAFNIFQARNLFNQYDTDASGTITIRDFGVP